MHTNLHSQHIYRRDTSFFSICLYMSSIRIMEMNVLPSTQHWKLFCPYDVHKRGLYKRRKSHFIIFRRSQISSSGMRSTYTSVLLIFLSSSRKMQGYLKTDHDHFASHLYNRSFKFNKPFDEIYVRLYIYIYICVYVYIYISHSVKRLTQSKSTNRRKENKKGQIRRCYTLQ